MKLIDFRLKYFINKEKVKEIKGKNKEKNVKENKGRKNEGTKK
jgi:hypothetical protein